MVKSRTTIAIDPELLKICQEKNYNVSAMTENAIINKYRMPEVEKIKELKCEFCGVVGEKETKEDVEKANRKSRMENNAKHPLEYSEETKLTWLWPDEKFICNRCLRLATHGVMGSNER